MSIAQYSSFWFPVVAVFFAFVLAVLVIFDYLYGRHFRALARVLLSGDYRNGHESPITTNSCSG